MVVITRWSVLLMVERQDSTEKVKARSKRLNKSARYYLWHIHVDKRTPLPTLHTSMAEGSKLQ